MKKKIILMIAFFLILTVGVFSYAQDNTDQVKGDLEKKIAEYQNKLEELRQQKNTLSSQIQYMDTQVYLTELRIQDTEKKILSIQKEIDTLSSRIEGLDNSLNYLSKLFLASVVNEYKQRNISVIDVLLDSNNANDLLNQVKYFQAAQNNKQKLFVQATETKLNFEEQKNVREKKKKELDSLQTTLKAQKSDLINQQSAKKQLLAVTQNDETVYQKLIEDAKRQIESFKQFVQSTGLGTILADGLGTGEGGWYYSQRDVRWANSRMGGSSESVLDVGCFITSIAMVMKFYGANFTPSDIANNAKYFSGGPNSACFPTSYATAYACLPSAFNGAWPNGKNYHNISYSDISSYLEKNVPVIAGVRGSSHYIVLKKIDGNDFIMNDPIYGPDKKVSDYYTLSGPYGVFE